ncbi:MAG: PQQ-binding-like beta-propeller repeat protein [Chloroflexota bacterium]|nr:PQQ-binding-like beta-propeller repeat protein [Chloroflexota bacterium]
MGSGLVLIGCDAPLLFALDALTGIERWRAELDGSIHGSAAVSNGAVFAADSAGSLTSFDLATGERRWSTAVKATNGWGAIADGVVYVPSEDGFLGVAVDDGSVRWTWKSSASIRHGTVVGDTAFIATDDGQFHAVALADGTERWSLELGGAATSPSISADTVYVGASQQGPERNGELYAVDIASGEIRWRYRPTSGNQITPCIVADGNVYAPSYADGLFAFDAEGNVLWNVPAPEAFCPLAMTGGVIYLKGDRALSAYAVGDGQKLWELDLAAFTKSGPVVTGGLAILGDDTGVVHAFADPAIAQLLPPAATAETTTAPVASATANPVASLTTVATFDAETSELDQPQGMDVGPDGHLYVVNAHRSEILVLAPDGSIVRRWGSPGSGDGEFNFRREPNDPGGDIGGVGVGADGSVYVADSGNRLIQQFDADGTFIRQWGRFGTGDGQFVDPIDLDVGPDGTVYVVDDQRDDIQAFSPDGGFLRVIGEHGTQPGQLNFTGGVFVGDDGTIYNADWSNHRVQAWDASGAVQWTLGTRGAGPGQFVEPSDVAVDDSSTLYAADRRGVQAFDVDRQLIASWRDPGLGPSNLAADGEIVYVASPWDDRIHVLSLPDE